MRFTEYYNQPSPELGEIADITVVSDAILAGEKNQSGKIEFLKATNEENLIKLVSASRTNNLTKHYDGLTVAFISPIGLDVSDIKYTLKIDELAPQPFKVKTEVKQGEYIIASFNNTDGFVSTNTPIPRSSATNSNSEITVATSKAVNDVRENIIGKQIIAGNGLTGGGSLSGNITLNIASANDGIVVNADNIELSTVDALTSKSATKPLSANQGNILDTRLKATETNKADKDIKITVGNGLSGGGTLAANMSIAHLSGNGWGHIPQNGAANQFIKFSSTGVGVWSNIDWSVIVNKPSTFPPSSHTHNKSQITDFPSSLPNPNSLTIQANGSTLVTYNGSNAGTANLTPANIGTYTRAEIDAKLLAVKSVPVPVGGLLMMYTTTNPAEIYTGTTWEAIANDRYLRTGASPLTLGGSNSVTLTKANLPNVKLKVDTFSLNRGTMEITGTYKWNTGVEGYSSSGAFTNSQSWNKYGGHSDSAAGYTTTTNFNASKTWTGSTSAGSPSTESLGQASPISILPEYINIRLWKRLS